MRAFSNRLRIFATSTFFNNNHPLWKQLVCLAWQYCTVAVVWHKTTNKRVKATQFNKIGCLVASEKIATGSSERTKPIARSRLYHTHIIKSSDSELRVLCYCNKSFSIWMKETVPFNGNIVLAITFVHLIDSICVGFIQSQLPKSNNFDKAVTNRIKPLVKSSCVNTIEVNSN